MLKEYILKDNQLSISTSTNKSTSSTSSFTDPVSLNTYRFTESSDNYIYRADAFAC